MPECTMNEQGQLVDGDGKAVEINGEAITVTGAKRQEEIDATFTREKQAHKAKLDALNQRIKTLEGQAEKTGEVERLLADMRLEKTALEAQLSDAEKNAESKVATQIETARTEASEAKAALEAEKAARVHDQVSADILSNAQGRFNNPGLDIVPHLLAAHKREPLKDEQGKDTGKYVDTFELTFEKDGKQVTEHLPVDKALDVWGQQNPHHVCASGRNGSGGGDYSNRSKDGKQEGFAYSST